MTYDLTEAIEEIKATVSLKSLMEHYGVEFRYNIACCPFHNDKRASLGVKNNRYYCFACGEHGDVIDFVKQYDGVSTAEAINTIATLYGIQLAPIKENNGKPDYGALSRKLERHIAQTIIKKAKEIKNAEYDYMCGQYRQACAIAEQEAPPKRNGIITEDYADAINEMQYWEYRLDIWQRDYDRSIQAIKEALKEGA